MVQNSARTNVRFRCAHPARRLALSPLFRRPHCSVPSGPGVAGKGDDACRGRPEFGAALYTGLHPSENRRISATNCRREIATRRPCLSSGIRLMVSRSPRAIGKPWLAAVLAALLIPLHGVPVRGDEPARYRWIPVASKAAFAPGMVPGPWSSGGRCGCWAAGTRATRALSPDLQQRSLEHARRGRLVAHQAQHLPGPVVRPREGLGGASHRRIRRLSRQDLDHRRRCQSGALPGRRLELGRRPGVGPRQCRCARAVGARGCSIIRWSSRTGSG